jgi:ATP dependent DNA ligase domain
VLTRLSPGLTSYLTPFASIFHCFPASVVCLDPDGKPQFRDLLFRRAEPLFYAFDILWDEHAKTVDDEENRRFRNGEDLRYLPLIDRKLRLHAVVPKQGERLHYCDHIDGDGEGLFRLACEHDLEGIVAKRKSDPYLREHTNWLKIRNQNYSQWIGREELFERERGSDPDFQVWDGCALACEYEFLSRRPDVQYQLALCCRQIDHEALAVSLEAASVRHACVCSQLISHGTPN